MKHTRQILVLTILLALCSSAFCQTKDVKDMIVKPRKKQTPAFYFKAYYLSPSYDLLNSINTDINHGKAFGILSHTNIGFSYRIPIYRSFYIQPEALYCLNTNWEDAYLNRDSFFPRMTYAFNNRLNSQFDFPIHIGLRWCPSKLFAARVYAGPIFQFTLAQGNFNFTPGYFLSMGVGLDLLNFLCLDAGYRVGMNNLTIYENTARYFLALSIKL